MLHEQYTGFRRNINIIKSNEYKKYENLPRTIIIRFLSRYVRNLYLRNKRDFLPKPITAEKTIGVKYYPTPSNMLDTRFIISTYSTFHYRDDSLTKRSFYILGIIISKIIGQLYHLF